MRIKGAALQRNGAGKKRSCVTQRGVQRRDGGLQWSEGQAEGRAGEGGGHNARGARTSPPPGAPQHRDAPTGPGRDARCLTDTRTPRHRSEAGASRLPLSVTRKPRRRKTQRAASMQSARASKKLI